MPIAFFKRHVKPVAFLVLFATTLLVVRFATSQRSTTSPFSIVRNCDDGTEMNAATWYENGVESSLNFLGKKEGNEYSTGLRFQLDVSDDVERIFYARLRFASAGSRLTSPMSTVIEGVVQNASPTFASDDRPSQKGPRTKNKVAWEIDEAWLEGDEALPLFYSSPDITPIINELLQKSGTVRELTLVLTAQNRAGVPENNFVSFYDYHYGEGREKRPVELEIFETVYDTFLGKELLGRVSDRSAEIYLYSLIDTDVHVEYGTRPGQYPQRSELLLDQSAGRKIRIELQSLAPDTRYYYRLAYRKAGENAYEKGVERSFHTQRPEGASFTFSIMSDEHLLSSFVRIEEKTESFLYSPEMNRRLYETTLQNIADSHPDFLISLGDFANTEFYNGRNATLYQDALERYLLQRTYIDKIATPFPSI
ncbi:MAG: hypothetical protein KJ645_03405 [Planctomycetes bacterium]|nr:hypothetical protein [Planctomycetota bacterium]